MGQRKEQLMDMYIERIVRTIIYLDSLYRILNELIQEPNDNLKEYDMVNLAQLISTYVHRLKLCIIKMQADWEFYGKRCKYL